MSGRWSAPTTTAGLYQRYADEPWHVERLAGARGSHCPALQAHP